MPPRLKKVPESAIHPMVGVPRRMDRVKMIVSDAYAFTDTKQSEVPLYHHNGVNWVLAGHIPTGVEFPAELLTTRFSRNWYGTSKLDGVRMEPWIAEVRKIDPKREIPVYLDGGFLKRVD
jgi:hypothetical protein